MLLNSKSSAKGRFSFYLKRNNVEKECFPLPSKNMILDAFLNVVNSNSSYSFSDSVNNRLARLVMLAPQRHQ